MFQSKNVFFVLRHSIGLTGPGVVIRMSILALKAMASLPGAGQGPPRSPRAPCRSVARMCQGEHFKNKDSFQLKNRTDLVIFLQTRKSLKKKKKES